MQAAHAESESTVSSSSRRTARAVFVATAVVLYLVDLGTKALVVERLADRGRVDLVGDLLGFRLTRNPGAAFGTGTSYTAVLSCVAVIAVGVVVWLSFRAANRVWAVALGLLLAGVLGNLTDRVFRAPGPFEGHVVDFIQLPHWPIFNVADMCINVAAVLILVQAFRGVRLDGRRDEKAETAND
jgi:signal peptidase II